MSDAALRLLESHSEQHFSVMRDEVLAALGASAGGVFIDATAGAGGHSEAILEANPENRVFAFDRDSGAVLATRERLLRFGTRVRVMHLDFASISEWLQQHGVGRVHGLLADLGLSSPQLSQADRGMSFRLDGPIDMRMDRSRGETAKELIERLTEDELADLIFTYGDERRSRRVARCIMQALAARELDTTLQLRRAVIRAVGPQRVGGVDPATKTFQALRIAVNRELDQLDALLAGLAKVVRPGGVAALISFHSLEDRRVKQAFLDASVYERLTKKPVVPSELELEANPRSRSAKLRAARLAAVESAPLADLFANRT